jgi:methyltransferase family protein
VNPEQVQQAVDSVDNLHVSVGAVLKQGAKVLLPDTAYRRLQEVRRQHPLRRRSADSLDLSRIGILREADMDELARADWLEHRALPALGLNYELLDEGPWPLLPEGLYGAAGGLLAWQLPNQFGAYLAHLSRYPITSYLEIGVRHGGTFVITVEYLRRFGELDTALGVDLSRCPSLAEYARLNPAARFMKTDSQSWRFRRLVKKSAPWDLVLIDGDHREGPLRSDFETVSDSARIVVLHDIASETIPTVNKVWTEIQSDHAGRFDFFEFTDQYDEVVRRSGRTWLGLGVAVDKSLRPGSLVTDA